MLNLVKWNALTNLNKNDKENKILLDYQVMITAYNA